MGGTPRRRALRRRSVLAALVVVGASLTLIGPSAANVSVSKSGWEWANPTPQGRTLLDIAFAGGTGYAVGYGGTVLSTSDAGQTWTGLTTGTTANLESVQALAPATVVVNGAGGCVTRISEDGGLIFKRIFNVAESGCPEPVAGVSFVSSRSGFLLLKDGAVEQTEDGGESFSRKTGIPGTPASSGGGALAGSQIHFFSAESGIAFVSSENGASSAYTTPDGGVSWAAVPLPSGAKVTSLYFYDERDGYAVGPETLLRTTDGGDTWTAEPIAAHNDLTSVDCATALRCVLTVSAGNELIETVDGGLTDTVKTTSSSLIYGAAYANGNDIVAVGESGATVRSTDAGATFMPASADIGGSYTRLREGPGAMLLAPGAHGNFAISTDSGETWRVIATQTSQELVDVSFASPDVGYALDASGGLQLTTNGGVSWQTLSPGTSRHADAVLAVGERAVLLIGPVGISRAIAGGPFEPLSGGGVASAHLSDYDVAGSTDFVFGQATHSLLRSTDEGASWTAVRLPLARKASRHQRASAGVAIRSVAFTSAMQGMLLDTLGRVWLTANGGRSWREILSTGTGAGLQLAFATPSDGFLSVRSFGGDSSDAYVLHTTNGGASWNPQEITAGSLSYGDLVDPTALDAAVLVNGAAVNGEAINRLLFSTATGGEIPVAPPPAGSPTPGTLTLHTSLTTYTARRLKAHHYTVRVTGTLSGAAGGENVVVARRNLAGGPWQEQDVVAGANGGSFSTTWRLTRSSVFVAQWSGASGRPGSGSKVLVVTVK